MWRSATCRGDTLKRRASERFGEIIVRAGSERLLNPRDWPVRLRAGYTSVAICACPQVAASSTPLLPGSIQSRIRNGKSPPRANSISASSALAQSTTSWPRCSMRRRRLRRLSGGPQSKESHGLPEKLSPFHRPLGEPLRAENGRMARLQVSLEQDDCQSMGRFGKFSLPDGAF